MGSECEMKKEKIYESGRTRQQYKIGEDPDILRGRTDWAISIPDLRRVQTKPWSSTGRTVSSMHNSLAIIRLTI